MGLRDKERVRNNEYDYIDEFKDMSQKLIYVCPIYNRALAIAVNRFIHVSLVDRMPTPWERIV